MSDASVTECHELIHAMLAAYNRGDAEAFGALVSDELPWRAKVIDEINSGRLGKVEIIGIVADGKQAAEYWVERGMTIDGVSGCDVTGVNFYRVEGGRVVGVQQVEEVTARPS